MKLTRIAAIVLPTAALVAVGAPFAAHAATQHTATQHTAAQRAATTHPATAAHLTKSAAAPSVAVYDCTNKPQVRPGTFYFFCDGSGYFANLKWSSWNAAMATATGVEYTDNCEPNCAAGKFSHQNVDVIFWRSEPVAHHADERGYTQMTVLSPNAKIGNHNTYTSSPPGVFPGEF
jgi:hypothetical protein